MATVWFGNKTLGSSNVSLPTANTKRAFRFQNNTGGAVQVQKLYINYSNTPTGGQTIKGVIYSDNAGAPNALLSTTPSSGITAGWVAVTFPSAVLVAKDAYVWIGVHGPVDTSTANGFLSGGTSATNADTYSDGASATFGAYTAGTILAGIYAEGTTVDSAVKRPQVFVCT